MPRTSLGLPQQAGDKRESLSIYPLPMLSVLMRLQQKDELLIEIFWQSVSLYIYFKLFFHEPLNFLARCVSFSYVVNPSGFLFNSLSPEADPLFHLLAGMYFLNITK